MSAVTGLLTSPLRASTQFFESTETYKIQHLIAKLNLKIHPEGGYFAETDRDPLQVPNPFLPHDQANSPLPSQEQQQPTEKLDEHNSTRSASTSIFYLLTPGNPKGNFHRNKGRTIHTLHRGRGRYVIIHADEVQRGEKARVETFIVGHNLQDGEKLQWVVEGGKYKASFLLPDADKSSGSRGLLISEVTKNLSSFALCFRPVNFNHQVLVLTLISRLSCRALNFAITTS